MAHKGFLVLKCSEYDATTSEPRYSGEASALATRSGIMRTCLKHDGGSVYATGFMGEGP